MTDISQTVYDTLPYRPCAGIMVLNRGRNRGVLGHEAAGRVAVMELATT